jgi:hypothetical protein
VSNNWQQFANIVTYATFERRIVYNPLRGCVGSAAVQTDRRVPSHLAAAPAEDANTPQPPSIDPLDQLAMSGVLANAARLGKPSVFDPEVQRARAALTDTPRRPYEDALVCLGQLAGALPSEGHHNSDSAPDATWTFSDTLWVVWEAKSEAKPDGELGSEDVL